MDRTTRRAGLGDAPWHGFFHGLLSIIILGLSAALYHHFKTDGDDFFNRGLRNVYLYDLIVPFVGRPIVLALALLIPLLYIAGFGWTVYEYQKYAKYLDHHRIALALVVFLGIAAFLGLLAFISEITMFRRRRTGTTAGPAVKV
ncbi:hypothetical protein FRC17_001281 [Serendipita sp. 399]|nr:hypothetical protein FRC17_001281 [Serendipita sp. 399]